MRESPRRQALASLRHRDLRYLWTASVATIAGQQVEVVVVAWHVYMLTESPLQLGLLGLFRVLPMLVLVLAGGAVADVVDRVSILRLALAARLAATGLLALATHLDLATPPAIYGLVTLSGAAAAFDSPARLALIPQIVPRAELSNAFTLSTLSREIGFVAGPLVGGVAVATLGLASAYAAGTLALLAAAAALLLLRPLAPVTREGGPDVPTRDAVFGGLRFLRRQPLLLALLAIDLPFALLSGLEVLLPIFARDVLGVGADGLGVLHAAKSAGAVAGGIALGSVGGVARPVAVVLLAAAAQGVALAGVGLSTAFPLTVALLFVMGAAGVLAEVPRVTILVDLTPDRLRGRVTALAQLVVQAGPRLGSVTVGGIATVIGPVGAALVGGAAVVLSVGAVARLGIVRRALGDAPSAVEP